MKARMFLTALLALCLTLAPALAEEQYGIVYPSQVESTLVDGRDFYVIANVPEDASSAVVRLINKDGEAVRVITGTDTPQFFIEYEEINAFNTDKAEYFMPDIIYRPEDPDSLWDGSIKCYMQNGLLFAVIPGGYYRMGGRDIVDENGKPYAPLTAGTYTLEVEAGDVTITEELSLGATVAKVMARFTPSGHLERVTQAALDGEIRTYFDPLPGYWSPSAIIPGQEDNPYFAEIKERWQLADSMEYVAGTVHFFVYNLSPSCATVAVELARLQLDEAIDMPRLLVYHYDIGEPLLGYADSISDAYLMGTLKLFDEGDRLVLTRAEITSEAQDNFYVAYEGDPRPVYLDVYDGISLPSGETLTLFGVLRPIQNSMSDMTRLTESAWEIGNRITEIEYAFSCGDKTWTERKEVGLNRMLAEGWQGYSIYEFAHSFAFEDIPAGSAISVALQGYDAHGAIVDGTAETLDITITD